MMDSNKGILIAVEGIDGAGKNTQVHALRHEMEILGYKVSEYSFPDYGGSVLGNTLKQMLAGNFGNATLIHPSISAPLFALERAEKCERIRADLSAGMVVLCDRYVYSNVAHQACRLPASEREDFQTWLEKVEFEILKLPVPDLTILLDADDHVASGRRRIRVQESAQERPLDDYEKDENSISLARTIYRSLASKLKWIVVPTGVGGKLFDRNAITVEILRNVEQQLPKAT
jgi:dTMP kinase